MHTIILHKIFAHMSKSMIITLMTITDDEHLLYCPWRRYLNLVGINVGLIVTIEQVAT